MADDSDADQGDHVFGGKGDDLINPTEKTFDANGVQTGWSMSKRELGTADTGTGSPLNPDVNDRSFWHGDEGDDIIFGAD